MKHMAIVRVPVEPTVLEWAVKRSQREAYLREKIPSLDAWLSGERQPTWRQLQDFANKAYVAYGYLFLKEPPEEGMPIADFRTLGSLDINEISPNLRDTIYICQRRQGWYRRYAIQHGHQALPFVGSAKAGEDQDEVAKAICEELGWNPQLKRQSSSFSDYRRSVVDLAEKAGIMVMINGVVADNTHRTLDPEEFRGFALSDEYAPLIFVNGKDFIGAQMFTIAHELAHIWRGQSALSDPDSNPSSGNRDEAWCNGVAAEILVPRPELERELDTSAQFLGQVHELSSKFKVSRQVILRRMLDMDLVHLDQYEAQYAERNVNIDSKSTGGNYHYTKPLRVSRRFGTALLCDTFELNTTYTEAFSLLEIQKRTTFDEFARQIGILP